MPELPEVETTRRGIEPHILHQQVTAVIVRHPKLRWKITPELVTELPQQIIRHVARRGKYLLLNTDKGTVIIHLGMSGSLRITTANQPVKKHDHVDIVFANGYCLRLTDPRRFGAVLWTHENPEQHPLLKSLGPEPLEKKFSGDYLFQRSRQRKVPIKQFIMNSNIVVGVGNIYANEALFAAKIHPRKAAGKITQKQYQQLANSIKKVLAASIKQGGTTLRDFFNSDGKPGYFINHLKVYDRGGLPCVICKTKLKMIRQGQRSTFFCPKCQKLN